MANNKSKDCGCVCNKCALNHDMHLHVEIENLKQRLVERDNHIVTMETTFLNEANKFPNGEFVALREELSTWQDKYSRLYEAHKRVQKVNQSLEDKLLKLVDKTETEKTVLTKDVATLSHRLADANYTIQRLQDDNEKYKNDVNLAIQLLQCKPGNFVSHRLDSLPNEVQAKVSSYVASRRKPPEDRKPIEVRSIKVPIPTFPPTAMVYSIPKTPSPEKDSNLSNDVDKPQVDLVSAAIMAKILEEREKERSVTKHCDTCTCSKHSFPPLIHAASQHSVASQTAHQKTSLCLRCSGDVDRSPLGSMKIIKTMVPNNETYPQNERQINQKVAVSENSKVILNAISDSFVKNPHHRLCNQNHQECDEPNKPLKGPRFCSMRVQSGSKNILLDNIHGNYAPVLYTRQESAEKKPKSSVHLVNTSRTNSTSSEERKSLSLSECDSSCHKQQRVAEWVQNIDKNEASGSEQSKKERISKLIADFDANQYEIIIQSQVKNYLYECEKLPVKKLSIVKQKYQSVPQSDASIIEMKGTKNTPTETEI